MPLHDWQFWVVTALAVWGGWMLLRMFMPRRRDASASDANCPTCLSNSSKSRKRGRRVALTVERRRV